MALIVADGEGGGASSKIEIQYFKLRGVMAFLR